MMQLTPELSDDVLDTMVPENVKNIGVHTATSPNGLWLDMDYYREIASDEGNPERAMRAFVCLLLAGEVKHALRVSRGPGASERSFSWVPVSAVTNINVFGS